MRRSKIAIATGSRSTNKRTGSALVMAFVFGEFAAHESYGLLAIPGEWVVTHVPSGRACRYADETDFGLSRLEAIHLATCLDRRCRALGQLPVERPSDEWVEIMRCTIAEWIGEGSVAA